jgi:hypothetical protein
MLTNYTAMSSAALLMPDLLFQKPPLISFQEDDDDDEPGCGRDDVLYEDPATKLIERTGD